MLAFLTRALVAFVILTGAAVAQNGPLRVTITDGVIEPIPVAIPNFVAQNAASNEMAANMARVIASDLTGTGLFREIPASAHIAKITSFGSTVQYSDWKAINAQALITGSVAVQGDGRIVVQFRLFDVFSNAPLGDGVQFVGTSKSWRRLAHKVADAVYARITGETGYFDSRVVFVSETGPKNRRLKRLAIMDYDGESVQFLTGSETLVLAPRFSPSGDRLLYTSYETGFPRVYLMTLANLSRQVLGDQSGEMSFAPRFAPDGQTVVYSLSNRGNTDIYTLNLTNGRSQRLTSAPSIETAPSFSPDGSRIVFESDRSGSPQIYVMSASGGEPRRISSGPGRYGTPVWSPRGDLVAFTKQNNGRFHIGVMRIDGSEERLLTGAFLDEGPSWSPNGRVIMFTRETKGANGAPALYSVDISGRNLKRVPTPGAASDPAWGPLLR